MSGSFRHRCESALTNPITLAALAALLLNDLLFKSIWPDSWVTGKVSDLAWVVFASPLLAFLLSLILSRNPATRRAAFGVSYFGLPLLYAAFNTFEPVHNAILTGLSIASGGGSGSPLDATDSLVIPFGMAVALWVWRRDVVRRTESLRSRWTLLIAAIALIATVATSESGPSEGVTQLVVSSDGVVKGDGSYRGFRSNDGGLTWDDPFDRSDTVAVGDQVVETPRGEYVISGPDIMRPNSSGQLETVYTARYLRNSANRWVQYRDTEHLHDRILSTGPRSMVYDVRSGNLIVAMGLQGVVIGTPDGRWIRVGVGPYSPTDFSFSAKRRLLFSNFLFWSIALSLTPTMMAIALLASQYRRDDLSVGVGPAAVSVLIGIGLSVAPALAQAYGNDAGLGIYLWTSLGGVVLAWVAAIAVGSSEREGQAWKRFALAMCIPSLTASGVLLFTFGVASTDSFSGCIVPCDASGIAVISSIIAFASLIPVFIVALAYSWRTIVRHWWAVLSALLGMNALIVLIFLLWIQSRILTFVAQFSVLILVALVAVVLAGYLRRSGSMSQDGIGNTL